MVCVEVKIHHHLQSMNDPRHPRHLRLAESNNGILLSPDV